MKGFPVEFGIVVRGPKCLNDGPTSWSKKFSDRFSRFDTIPAVTDTQPASHVAVAITLNALDKASSLKTRHVTNVEVTTTTGCHPLSHLVGYLTDVCGPLDRHIARSSPQEDHHRAVAAVIRGCLQIGSDRQEDPATPGFVQ